MFVVGVGCFTCLVGYCYCCCLFLWAAYCCVLFTGYGLLIEDVGCRSHPWIDQFCLLVFALYYYSTLWCICAERKRLIRQSIGLCSASNCLNWPRWIVENIIHTLTILWCHQVRNIKTTFFLYSSSFSGSRRNLRTSSLPTSTLNRSRKINRILTMFSYKDMTRKASPDSEFSPKTQILLIN